VDVDGQITCDCAEGYTGRNCDQCAPGAVQSSQYPYNCVPMGGQRPGIYPPPPQIPNQPRPGIFPPPPLQTGCPTSNCYPGQQCPIQRLPQNPWPQLQRPPPQPLQPNPCQVVPQPGPGPILCPQIQPPRQQDECPPCPQNPCNEPCPISPQPCLVVGPSPPCGEQPCPGPITRCPYDPYVGGGGDCNVNCPSPCKPCARCPDCNLNVTCPAIPGVNGTVIPCVCDPRGTVSQYGETCFCKVA
jgi:hypothetical protein